MRTRGGDGVCLKRAVASIGRFDWHLGPIGEKIAERRGITAAVYTCGLP